MEFKSQEIRVRPNSSLDIAMPVSNCPIAKSNPVIESADSQCASVGKKRHKGIHLI